MCYLPIHNAMVAFVFKVTGKVPKTETEIYAHFTQLTIMRSLSKNRKIETIDVLYLNEDDQKLFNQICEIALAKTLLNKQVISQDEVKSYFQTKKDRDISLGLITVDRSAGLYGFKDIYTFLHLTFQEYLAACHISTLGDKEQDKLIEEYGHKNHMLVVWKFYCGLTKSESKFEKVIMLAPKNDPLFGIYCAYESQMKAVSKIVLEHTINRLEFADKYLMAPDFTALGYVMANASTPFELSFSCCHMTVEAVNAISSEMGGKRVNSLRGMNYTTEKLDEVEQQCLKILLANFESLKHLRLQSKTERTACLDLFDSCTDLIELTAEMILIQPKTLKELLFQHKKLQVLNTCLTNWPKITSQIMDKPSNTDVMWTTRTPLNTSLKTLVIKSMFLNDDGAEWLANVLCQCRNIQHLDLSQSYHLGPTATDSIFTSIHDIGIPQSSLTVLSLGGCTIGRKGTRAVSKCLKCWPNLQELDLSDCSLHEGDGAMAIAENLHHCTKLTKLNLSSNQLNKKTAPIFSRIRNSSLTELDLGGNRISREGAHAISMCLQYWPNLQELDLSDCSLHEGDGAMAIAENLHHCTKLTTLNLSLNQLSENSAPIFSRIRNSSLTVLDLGGNRISREGARAISMCLQCWPNLQELNLSNGLYLAPVEIKHQTNKISAPTTWSCSSLTSLGVNIVREAGAELPCQNLQELDLSTESYNGAMALSENLHHCTKLTKLNLSRNQVQKNSAPIFSRIRSSSLTFLDLSVNRIGREGAQALSMCLQYLPNLQVLDLSGYPTLYPNIGDDGAMVLAENLHQCTQLTKLNLSWNEITEHSAFAIIQTLQNCTDLNELDLGHNRIRKEDKITVQDCAARFWKSSASILI